MVHFLRVGFKVSEWGACRAVGVHRTIVRYQSCKPCQAPLRQRIKELAAVRVCYGYRRIHVLLRREGWPVNIKRVYRLYREEGLSLRYKRSKKRVSAPRVTPPPAKQPNERWRIDFLKDALMGGRGFRVFTVVDNVRVVSPAIEAVFSLKGGQVVAVLDGLKATVGVPKRLAVDNGPEFISKAPDSWAYRNGVQLEFSRPGSRRTMPSWNRLTDTFDRNVSISTGLRHWRRRGRSSRHGESSTTRSDRTKR